MLFYILQNANAKLRLSTYSVSKNIYYYCCLFYHLLCVLSTQRDVDVLILLCLSALIFLFVILCYIAVFICFDVEIIA